MRRYALVLVALCVATVAHAAASTQERKCPIVPGTTTDEDRISLSGPLPGQANGQVAYQVKVDEADGEAQHVVSGVFVAVSTDGGDASIAPVAPAESPAIGTLTVQLNHHYTVHYLAGTDFGAHTCSSEEPGQSPFSI